MQKKIEILEKCPNKLEFLTHDVKWCYLNWNLIKKYVPKKTCVNCFKHVKTPVMICEHRHQFHFKCLRTNKGCIVCEYIQNN
mgnify:CR=1 FL=1